jgi:hypothetical protein
VDTDYNKFKDKMNEHLKNRIPLTCQHLNFREIKDENGPNLKSSLDEIDSKFEIVFDKILLKLRFY